MTLARLLRCGNSAKSWNIRPTPRFSGGRKVLPPETSWSLIRTRPCVGCFNTGGKAQQRGLAATGAAEQADDLAGLDHQREVAHRDHIAVAMGDVIIGQLGGDRCRRSSGFDPRDRGARCGTRCHLFLGILHAWRETEIEIARLKRIFVFTQRRIVGRHRHREIRRQMAFQHARALSARRDPADRPVAPDRNAR